MGVAPSPAAVLAAWNIRPASLTPVTTGHINASWRVVSSTGEALLLQRLNPDVFHDGRAVMRNIALVTRHLADQVASRPDAGRRALVLLACADGAPAWQAEDAAWWRLFRFIEGARSSTWVTTPGEALEVGRAFGEFQRMLRTYAGPPLVETIPGFHDTAARVAALESAVARDPGRRVASLGPECEMARARAGYAAVLPPLLASGALPQRIVHNDAKASNVLLDAATGEALAVVDLDTVMPGTLLYDVGDLIRSIASPSEEDEADLSRIVLRPDLVAALARGFLGACGSGLTEAERRLFIFAGLLLTYEQGIRFLTDHVEGDRYYRVSRPGQNLDRARAQFHLLTQLEGQRSALEAMVAGLTPEYSP